MKERIEKALKSLEEVDQKFKVSAKKMHKAFAMSVEVGGVEVECCEEEEEEEEPEVTQADLYWLNLRIDSLRQDIQYLQTQFYRHQDGHLPPIVGAEKLQTALTALGLANDYEVKKTVLYASDGAANHSWTMVPPSR